MQSSQLLTILSIAILFNREIKIQITEKKLLFDCKVYSTYKLL